MIHEGWCKRKLSDEQAKLHCIESRAVGCDKLLNLILWNEEQVLVQICMRQARLVREIQEAGPRVYKSSQVVLDWMSQYRGDPENNPRLRFKPLLIQGESRCGKTTKALSLFGRSSSLLVGCQGLGDNLPSLREFRPRRHAVIIFDEVSSGQGLSNKLVFQAGCDPVTLSQSACNAHAYSKYLHAVPMILLSNDFQLETRPGSSMTEQDAEYLAKNVMDASLPPGEKWFDEEDDHELPEI